jgi:hypothetical protein
MIFPANIDLHLTRRNVLVFLPAFEKCYHPNLRVHWYLPVDLKGASMCSPMMNGNALPINEMAMIEKDILLIGSLNKWELWSPGVFDRYIKENNPSLESLAQEINFSAIFNSNG